MTSYTWEKLRPLNPPPPRWGHTMTSYGKFLFVFGGSQLGATYNDLWYLNTEDINPDDWNSLQWVHVSVGTAVPECRGGHSAILMGAYLYIFGGNNISHTFSDMWRIDLSEILRSGNSSEGCGGALIYWENMSQFGTYPSPRIGHCAVALSRYTFLVYGGRNYIHSTMSQGCYVFDTRTNTWSSLLSPTDSGIVCRTGHCALPTSVGVIFFGGLSANNSPLSEVLVLDLFSSPQYSRLKSEHESSTNRGNASDTSYSFSVSQFLQGIFPITRNVTDYSPRENRYTLVEGENEEYMEYHQR